MITDILTKFDVVMNHILTIQRKGINLPLYMDIDNWNKAQKMTMELARKGLLNEFYNRIVEGKV